MPPMPSERGMVCLMGEHATDFIERDDPYYCRQCGRYLPYDFTMDDLEDCDCICPVCKTLHIAVGFTRR